MTGTPFTRNEVSLAEMEDSRSASADPILNDQSGLSPSQVVKSPCRTL
jgi:hypothetical protein